MSLLRPRKPRRLPSSEARGFGDSLADLGVMRPQTSASAVSAVTPGLAMRVSTVWACVSLLADLVSTLPVAAYRTVDGRPVPVVPQPQILRDPSVAVDALAWRRQVMVGWLLRGNTFGLVTAVRSGWPAQVELVHPDRVTAERVGRSGVLQWRVDGTRVEEWPAGPLWHVPGLTMPGDRVGVSVVAYAAEHIGVSRAALDYGTRWYEDGAHPSAILKTEHRLDEQQARQIKERFVAAVRGRREPAVLGAGLDYQPIQVSAAEAQFLETIRASAEDIARFFFPSFVLASAATSVTYANVEQRSLNLLTYDLDPWLVRLEAALTALLPGGSGGGQYVRVDRAGLLRTDAMTRARLADLALRGGWKSRDEIRAEYELPPIPDGTGSRYLWPPYRTAAADDDTELDPQQ